MSTSTTNDPFKQVLTTVDEAIRKSQLVNELHEKLEDLPPGAFPFATEFGKLRDVIAPQIGDTRILFPEFTPHDESLHVVKLFQLADKFFHDAYKQLNAAELFLLASALYAHDWGMAIGQQELDFLRHGALNENLSDTFSPLPDELERLEAFVCTEGLQKKAAGAFSTLSDNHLRFYVRLTHARRSGARIRAHFHEHPAIGEALAHLCEGHWYDFAMLDDPQRFPRNYEVAGQTVHLLALALMVRLLDLFHITEDRTPYALWRFVNPVSSLSKGEWQKHRALHGIAVNDFPPGRAIKVQGFTEDEQVWAGLQDLRKYCEDQVKHTLDLSARHVPKRYMLDFLRLDWAVTTGALRPIDLSFGFDNRAMFRILSDDIYDGDRYIFLRELLQNSIDAIRLRHSLHEQRKKDSKRRKVVGKQFDTTIYFTVEHQSNGDINVACRDYGIGMDEHVIRNYFTIAGISYYRSDEFKRQHVGFEPVSRFGIGILSCFMVADMLDVKTYRDPECGPPMTYTDRELPGAEEHLARRLQLIVPAIERQFIVKELHDDFEVGTQISLKVLQEKAALPTKGPEASSETDNSAQSSQVDFKRTLEITEYLSEIAGFVEFPILVEETWPGQDTPKLTIILHPDTDAEYEKQQFDDKVLVHQLTSEYPWEQILSSESVGVAREFLTEHRFDISQLLPDKEYEGWLTYPMPLNEEWDFGSVENTNDRYLSKRTETKPERLLLQRHLDHSLAIQKPRVYRDGILLSNIALSDSFASLFGSAEHRKNPTLFPKIACINLSSSETPQTNVSRSMLKSTNKSWEKDILASVDDWLIKNRIADALSLPPKERLYKIGWIDAVFDISEKVLDRAIPDEKMVTLWVTENNKLEVREGALVGCDEIPILPVEAESIAEQLTSELWNLPLQFKSSVNDVWVGPPSYYHSPTMEMFTFRDTIESAPKQAISALLVRISAKSFIEKHIQFLEPFEDCLTPIEQSIYHPVKEKSKYTIDQLPEDRKLSERQARLNYLNKPEVSEALELTLKNPDQLNIQQLYIVNNSVEVSIPVRFSSPFADCFSTYSHRINSRNEVGKMVFRCLAACCLAERDKRLPESAIRSIEKINHSYRPTNNMTSDGHALFNLVMKQQVFEAEFAEKLFRFVKEQELIEGFIPPSIPSASETVPAIYGRIESNTNSESATNDVDQSRTEKFFGKLIEEWPLPSK